jgi:glycerol-3-phosphate dehydrogenase
VTLPELSATTRARDLDEMVAKSPLDVLIVGGGINGACVARDAAMRGMKAAVVEQDHFASGTSSKSSKLIHGGLRYLEHLEFGLVFESLQERGLLLSLAPNLVRPLEFVFPVYQGDKHGIWKIDAGLWAYDLMSMFRKVKRHHRLAPARVASVVPGLRTDGLRGAIAYDDAGTDDASLTLTMLRSAKGAGALVANMARVVGLLMDGGRVVGATVEDRLTGQRRDLKAKAVVNVAGPWVDAVRKMAAPKSKALLRPTKGCHLSFPRARLPVDRAVVLAARRDRRIVYVIPWLAYTLLGTTDTDHTGDPGDLSVTQDDVAYLLETANHYFPNANLKPEDVTGSFAGLRPLLDDGKSKPSDVSRRYSLTQDTKGLFTLTGGKLTTARRMAADTLDLVIKTCGLKPRNGCRTDLEPLLEDLPLEKLIDELAGTPGLTRESADYLARCYGSDARELTSLAKERPDLATQLLPAHPLIKAQVVFAWRHDMIESPEAFLAHYGKGAFATAPGAREAVEAVLAVAQRA